MSGPGPQVHRRELGAIPEPVDPVDLAGAESVVGAGKDRRACQGREEIAGVAVAARFKTVVAPDLGARGDGNCGRVSGRPSSQPVAAPVAVKGGGTGARSARTLTRTGAAATGLVGERHAGSAAARAAQPGAPGLLAEGRLGRRAGAAGGAQ